MVLARCDWAWQRQRLRWQDRCLEHLVDQLGQGRCGTPNAPFIPAWWRTLDAWWFGARSTLLVHAMMLVMLGSIWTARHDLIVSFQPWWATWLRWTHMDPTVLTTPFWHGVAHAAVLGWGAWALSMALRLHITASAPTRPFHPRSRAVQGLLTLVRGLRRHAVPLLVLSLLWGAPWRSLGVIPPVPEPGTPMITLTVGGAAVGMLPVPSVLLPVTLGLVVMLEGCERLIDTGVLLLHLVRQTPRTVTEQWAYGQRQRASHYQAVDRTAHRLFEQRQLAAVATVVMTEAVEPSEACRSRDRRRL